MSVLQDKKVLEMFHNSVNILNTTELYTWLKVNSSIFFFFFTISKIKYNLFKFQREGKNRGTEECWKEGKLQNGNDTSN